MGRILTVSGDLGSGKTSVAKALAARLGYRYLSTGQLHRDMATEMGLNALELNIRAESDPEIDRRIDGMLLELADEAQDYVIDSRVAWHFVRGSLKIYLTADPDVAAERITEDKARVNEPSYLSVMDAKAQLLARAESENRRFFAKYGISRRNPDNYDVIVDTTLLSTEDVLNQLLVLISQWQIGRLPNKLWTSPKLLFPTEHVRQLGRSDADALCADMADHGFDPEYPVEIAVSEGFSFIWNGHKRTSAALLNKIPVIPIILIAEDGDRLPTGETAEEFARAAIYPSNFYDWEDVHKFRFIKYPRQNDAQRP